jgi:methylmalonyl-CoA/ethylmalonyl-CoA epimerase
MTARGFQIKGINQIAFVVRDLDRAMESYWRAGIGPWRIYTYGPPLVKDQMYRGRPCDAKFLMALAEVGGLGLELIQPLSGESLYTEFLERHGEGGFQHLGINVEDLDREVEAALRSGYEVIQSGRGFGVRGDGKFAYLSTDNDLLTIYELRELSKERVAPDRVYPGSD